MVDGDFSPFLIKSISSLNDSVPKKLYLSMLILLVLWDSHYIKNVVDMDMKK